jgi:hypothetical protein
MRAGQDTINWLRVPPKWLATGFLHCNGEFIACVQALQLQIQRLLHLGVAVRV